MTAWHHRRDPPVQTISRNYEQSRSFATLLEKARFASSSSMSECTSSMEEVIKSILHEFNYNFIFISFSEKVEWYRLRNAGEYFTKQPKFTGKSTPFFILLVSYFLCL